MATGGHRRTPDAHGRAQAVTTAPLMFWLSDRSIRGPSVATSCHIWAKNPNMAGMKIAKYGPYETVEDDVAKRPGPHEVLQGGHLR